MSSYQEFKKDMKKWVRAARLGMLIGFGVSVVGVIVLGLVFAE